MPTSGGVSGISAPGEGCEKVTARAAEIGQDWAAEGLPTDFYALGGIGRRIPLRATVTDSGPVLLSKVLGLNRTQEQSLGLIFHYADGKGLELVDLKDLRAVVAFLVSDEGKARRGAGARGRPAGRVGSRSGAGDGGIGWMSDCGGRLCFLARCGTRGGCVR